MRMGMRRFTRLTNAFSKKVENLTAAVSLHFLHYNFARPHKSLSKPYPTTPTWQGRGKSCLDLGRNRGAARLRLHPVASMVEVESDAKVGANENVAQPADSRGYIGRSSSTVDQLRCAVYFEGL